MPLSATAVENARPKQRPYKMGDEGGLYLLVNPTGSKLWRYDFRLCGKRRTMALGNFPDVKLGAARERHRLAREAVARGDDPVQQAKAANLDNRFEAVARDWWEARRGGWTKRYADTILNRLERNVFPVIGHHQIAEVARPEILSLLRVMEARGAIEAARRMKNVIGEIYKFAIADGRAATNPTEGMTDALKRKPPKKRRAALKASELPTFLVRLRDADDEEQDTLDAMRLTLLTAVRTVEMRFAAAEEFEDMTGKQPLWRIGADRMKPHGSADLRTEHLVPLSRQAAEIVRWRLDMVDGRGLLFARRTVSGTLSENTMLFALYRMGYHSRATVHGFRGSFSTIANEHGWNKDWIERQLAHVEQDAVRGAYNAAEYLPGRRKLLQWWADFLDSQEAIGRLLG